MSIASDEEVLARFQMSNESLLCYSEGRSTYRLASLTEEALWRIIQRERNGKPLAEKAGEKPSPKEGRK